MRPAKKLEGLRALAALALLAGCAGPAPEAGDTALTPEPCRLRGGSGMTSVAAECGTLRVPENPQAPDGAQIDLFVARLPAINPRFPGTAFTVIAGGPGQASTDFYADYEFAFRRVLRYHDIVLVDQRGTGGSNALDCEYDETEMLEYSPGLAARQAQECLDELPGDPRFYTTSIAVADLDRVRAALGYEQLDLYGASYGTRVALHYLRRYPERVRTVTLDGVIAADQVIGPKIALDAQAALDSIFIRCSEDPACNEKFADPAAQFGSIRRELRESPVEVTLPHPVTGEQVTVPLNYTSFAGAVRLLSYTPGNASLLPVLLNEAEANDNWQPMAAQAEMMLGSLIEALNEGMHNAIVCTEDAPLFELSESDRESLRETYLGESIVDALQAICGVWPAGVIDPGFHEPVASDKPVLLLSGSADPVTPPANASRAAATLSDSLEIVANGYGHGVLAVSCVPSLLADFVHAASTAAVDPGCVASKTPDPFFTGFTGPEP